MAGPAETPRTAAPRRAPAAVPSPDRARPRPRDPVLAAVRWSRGVLAAAALLAALATALPLGPWPPTAVLALAAVGLLAGLPHGSIDHVLAARMTGWSTPVVAAGYGVVALASWGLLVALGPPVLAAVLLLSLVHFALGELEVTRATTGWAPSPAVAAAVGLAGTGALLLPLARAGDALGGVAAAISPDLATVLASPITRAGLAGAWVVAAVVASVAGLRAHRPGVVVDLVVLAAAALLLPPLVAFALWFGAWHGLRHLGRLLALDPEAAALDAAGRRGRAVRRLAHLAWWPTLAATAVLVALVALTATAGDPSAALGSTLVILLALTVPHMLVVLWVDERARRDRRERRALRPR